MNADSSLTLRHNWPTWAQEATQDATGLEALELLAAADQQLAFIGTPFAADIDPFVSPRISSYTGPAGEYVRHDVWKITADRTTPKHAVMRAIINRPGMADTPNIEARCWSGGFPYRGEFQPITTIDMIRQARQDQRMRAVGVVSLQGIDADNITLNMHNADHLVDITGVNCLRLDLVVPVYGWRDLSPDMLVIDDETVTRQQTPAIFASLMAHGDAEIPHAITIQTDEGERSFAIKRLGDLVL
jgi:hypothetical protein